MSLPNGTIVNAGDTIQPSQHNPVMEDIANQITGSLSRDGLGGMRADLAMGGFKATNLGAGTNPGDAVRMDQLMAVGVPVGAVIDFAGTTPPTGWLFAAGQAVSRVTYAAAFAALGTAYGAGDGSTTFNLPDLRGRVVAGRDNMDGTDAGRLNGFTGTTLGAGVGVQNVTLTIDQMPAHDHPVTDPGHAHGYTVIAAFGGIAAGGGYGQYAADTNSATTGVTVGNRGGGAAHGNVQPTLILNKIVRVS